MSEQEKRGGSSTLTILEAVETLSNIADLEINPKVGVAHKHELVLQDKPISFHTVHWLNESEGTITIEMIKDIFSVILHYLRNFYKNEYGHIEKRQTIEGIKTIMVLVGEAAKKLDRYTALFQDSQTKSVTELKEYKKLQDFYLNRIDRKIDEGMLGKWILALAKKTKTDSKLKLEGKKNRETKHIFIDLDSVKKDIDYELFFMRKEDGSRFFSPRLIRNIKLVSDFGDYFGEEKKEDPLLSTEVWFDRVAHSCAQSIITATRRHIDKFYREAMNYKDHDLVESIHKSLMALKLAANSHNLSHHLPIKDCRNYFSDFLTFLRDCLQTSEYQHLTAYPPHKGNKAAMAVVDVLHVLCMAIYTQLNGLQQLQPFIHTFITKAHEGAKGEGKQGTVSAQLLHDYKAMSKLMKLHPNGPVNKILQALEEGRYHEFDPMLQENLPLELFAMYLQESRCLFVRWPSPTHQDFIHKAAPIDEFKAFLYACQHEHELKKCLVINLQDRSTWKEHFRCKAIEDLQNQNSFEKNIEVATLAKDTEFYYQMDPYHQETRADIFMHQFKEQFVDENCGFLFSPALKRSLFKEFIDPAMKAVHEVFFGGKNVLAREDRMDFIEIFYLFLELKIIDLIQPDITGFCCKDAIDTTLSASALLFVFVKFLSQERLSEIDREQLDLMLYGPSMLFRERVMLPERFNRMASALNAIESVREEKGHAEFVKTIKKSFGPLFNLPLLQAKLVVPRHPDQL